MKKFIVGLLAGLSLVAITAAQSANLGPLYTSPAVSEPSQTLQTINNTILSLNNGVDGLLASCPLSANTTGTAIQSMLSYNMATAQIPNYGQMIHMKAWGANSNDSNAKTFTWYISGNTTAYTLTGAANNWVTDFYLENVGPATGIGTTSNIYMGMSNAHEGSIALSDNTTLQYTFSNNTVNGIAPLAIQLTAATAGSMTLDGCYVEQIK